MKEIRLGYGRREFAFEFDDSRFDVLRSDDDSSALTDPQIGAKLASPIGSKPLEEIISPGESILIVVPDATRAAATGQIVNLLIRRLIVSGIQPSNIAIIFATGIHRKVTEEEKRELLTPFIAQRVKTLDHDAGDLAQFSRLGKTLSGIPVELNRALLDYDRVIIVGGISFHYFAGFTGGRKLICPGLASSQTISETHKLAFDFEKKTRRAGVGSGLLKGNAVNETFMEVVEKCPPSFSINSLVNDRGEATEIYVGDWKLAHAEACESYAQKHTISIKEKREVVIVSCGGFPFDLNMIQAHKSLEAASHGCNDGGTIIFLAECADGLGRADFLKWFEHKDSRALAGKLCEAYQVNGQTAWNLLSMAERFDVQIVTGLPDKETRSMRMTKTSSLEKATAQISTQSRGYIIPNGARIYLELEKKQMRALKPSWFLP